MYATKKAAGTISAATTPRLISRRGSATPLEIVSIAGLASPVDFAPLVAFASVAVTSSGVRALRSPLRSWSTGRRAQLLGFGCHENICS